MDELFVLFVLLCYLLAKQRKIHACVPFAVDLDHWHRSYWLHCAVWRLTDNVISPTACKMTCICTGHHSVYRSWNWRQSIYAIISFIDAGPHARPVSTVIPTHPHFAIQHRLSIVTETLHTSNFVTIHCEWRILSIKVHAAKPITRAIEYSTFCYIANENAAVQLNEIK